MSTLDELRQEAATARDEYERALHFETAESQFVKCPSCGEISTIADGETLFTLEDDDDDCGGDESDFYWTCPHCNWHAECRTNLTVFYRGG